MLRNINFIVNPNFHPIFCFFSIVISIRQRIRRRLISVCTNICTRYIKWFSRDWIRGEEFFQNKIQFEFVIGFPLHQDKHMETSILLILVPLSSPPAKVAVSQSCRFCVFFNISSQFFVFLDAFYVFPNHLCVFYGFVRHFVSESKVK